MKRFLTGMLCAGILTSQPAVTYAAETSATPEAGHSETYSQASDIDSVKGWPAGPNIEGQSAVLMDAVTDTILYSKNAKDKLYPASITKIMTDVYKRQFQDRTLLLHIRRSVLPWHIPDDAVRMGSRSLTSYPVPRSDNRSGFSV